MRSSIDTNVLVYSVDTRDARVAMARRIVTEAVVADCVLTNQAIGEFLNVVKKKAPVSLLERRRAATDWSILFPLLPTSTEQLIAASVLSEQSPLRYWDAVVLTVAGDAGVDHLFSEDMQDGAVINGVRIVDPFNPSNADLVAALLIPTPG